MVVAVPIIPLVDPEPGFGTGVHLVLIVLSVVGRARDVEGVDTDVAAHRRHPTRAILQTVADPVKVAPALAESPDPVSTVIRLPRSVPPVLGLGAFLKNTVCLARGNKAMVSRDIGNLDSADALRRFEETVERLVEGQGIALSAAAPHLPPDFYGTRPARGPDPPPPTPAHPPSSTPPLT